MGGKEGQLPGELKKRSECFDGGKDDGSHVILKVNRKCHPFPITFRVRAAAYKWVHAYTFLHSVVASVWVPWGLRMAPCLLMMWELSGIASLLPSSHHPSSSPLAPLGCLDLSPDFSEDGCDPNSLEPHDSDLIVQKDWNLYGTWFSSRVRQARTVSGNPALFLDNASFRGLVGQEQLFLLFGGCVFGRVQRNSNQASLGLSQRRSESSWALELWDQVCF